MSGLKSLELGRGLLPLLKVEVPDKDRYLVPTAQVETHSVGNDTFIWQ